MPTKPGFLPGAGAVKTTLLFDEGTYTALPDTDTEISHDLGVVPATLNLVPQTTGVAGYVMESARSATSITIRASTSGVDTKWQAIR